MRIGIFAPLGNPFATPAYVNTLGPAAEERGFHSIWVAEHVVLFDDYASRYPYAADGRIPAGGENGILEPFTALAFLAAGTSQISASARGSVWSPSATPSTPPRRSRRSTGSRRGASTSASASAGSPRSSPPAASPSSAAARAAASTSRR
jgi:hypothetical protein